MPPAPTDRSVEAILAVARTLASTLDLDLLFERILDTLTPVVSADRSTLFLVEATGELRTRVAQGTDRRDLVLPAGTGIAGWVAENGTSVRLEDAYTDPRFYPAWDGETSYRTKSLLCVPFRNAEGTVVGVMQCLNKPEGFSAHDQALLEAIGHQCAVALDNARLVRRLEQRNDELARAHAQLRKKTEELEILARLERSIGTARDEDTILREALGLVCELFDTRDASALLLGDVNVVVSVHASDSGEGGQDIRMRSKRISRQWADALLLRFDGPTLSGDDEGHHVVSAIEVDGQRLGALQIVRLAAVEESGLRVLSMIAGRVGRAIAALREQALNDRDDRLQMLGQMMSGVLHDLRTPLSAIGGYAELMAEEEDPSEREYYLSRVRTGLSHLEAMTTEVLEFSRGRWELALEDVSLEDFATSVRQVVVPDIDRFGAMFLVEGAQEGTARFDPNRLRRVLSNLARNAGEAGARTIRWVISQNDRWLAFEVSDDGKGISESVRHRLFQPFATHGKQNGTGLGLAMARRIIDAHQGTIEVESEPGRGATFRILLPITSG